MNEPNLTCPIIDGFLKDLDWSRIKLTEKLDTLIEDSQKALENLRTLNSELRDWGRAGWDKAEEFENEAEELKDQLKEMENDYEIKLKELEEKLADYQREIRDIENDEHYRRVTQ